MDKLKLKVKDCMGKDIVTLKKSSSFKEILKLFKKYNYHILPVVDSENRLVGVVTLNEILNIFQPYDSHLAQMLKANPLLDYTTEETSVSLDVSAEIGLLIVADDIISSILTTINPEASIKEAYSRMKLHKVEKLMVTVEDNKLVGIITLFDIIYSIFKQKGLV